MIALKLRLMLQLPNASLTMNDILRLKRYWKQPIHLKKITNVLNDLIRVNLKLGTRMHLGTQRKLLQTRRPDKNLIKEAYEQLGSDLFIFTNNRCHPDGTQCHLKRAHLAE